MKRKVLIKVVSSVIVILLITIAIFTNLSKIVSTKTNTIVLHEFQTNRTDKKPLINRFSMLKDFKSCLWQSALISDERTNFGPSSYWIRGYIVLNDETLEEYKSRYEWTSAKATFSNYNFTLDNGKGIPCIDFSKLSIKESEWFYSSGFEEDFTKGFIGVCYLDKNNGIVFFELQNI